MPSTRLRPALLGALGILAVAPAAASAATIAYEGDTLVVRAAPGATNSLSIAGEVPGRVAISDSYEGFTFPADRCSQDDPVYAVQCEIPGSVRVELGDGADSGVIHPTTPAGLPVAIQGGDGADDLKQIGGATRATLDGGSGDDVLFSEEGADLLLGGPGADRLTGGKGADALHGGDGDDQLRGDGEDHAPDVLDGGAGLDVVEDWGAGYDAPLVNVTLDGLANDGRAGEGDDVRDVETVRVFVAAGIVMGDGPDTVENHSPADAAASTIQGRGGDDRLTGGSASHTIDGGPGDDRVEGGWGHDVLTGGPGRDQIFGDSTSGNCGGSGQSCRLPFGNDVIDARDGEADTIDCGVGEDRATVDAIDTVAACETVERAGAAAPAPGAGKARAGAKLTLAGRARLRKALRSGLVVRLSGLPKGRIVVRARHGRRTVATGRATVKAAGTATVRLRFTRAARRALARRRSVRLTITAGPARRVVTLKG